MLEVCSMEEALACVMEHFGHLRSPIATLPVHKALGRVLASDLASPVGMPPFNRSTVDGFAVHAADTFGASEALPAILELAGSVEMGGTAPACAEGACVAIPTGGMLPAGADAVVMVEHCEDFGDGTIGVLKAVAPGDAVVYAHDELAPGDVVLAAGQRIEPHHIGALASIGISEAACYSPVRVGVLSTGDEIVPATALPQAGQMRDVNGPVIRAAVAATGAEPIDLGIAPDSYEAIAHAIEQARSSCDVVLVSGGSSVGQRDTTERVFSAQGDVLLHGIAIKPGKPTLLAKLGDVPAFGLPGHPAAACIAAQCFVRPLLLAMMGNEAAAGAAAHGGSATSAVLTQAIPSNHGRSELVPVSLAAAEDGSLRATPIRSKSGLIALLAQAQGYIVVPREAEGLPIGARVEVKPFTW